MPDHEAFKGKLAATPKDKIAENLTDGRYAAWKRPIAQAYLDKLASNEVDAAKQEEEERVQAEQRRTEDGAKRQQRFDNRVKIAGLTLTALGIVAAAVLGYLRL